MYDKTIKNDVDQFVKNLKAFIQARMGHCTFPLSDYMDPTNQLHLSRLSSIYNMSFDVNLYYKQFVFARFVSSWQNGTGKGFIDEKKMGNEIRLLTCDFDIDKFLLKYGTIDSVKVFEEINYQKTNKYPVLKSIRRKTDVMNFSEGVFTLAKLVKNYDDRGLITHLSKNHYSDYLNNQKDIHPVKGNVEYVVGMSWTLLADALKETNLVNIAKPDIHIVEILNNCFGEKISIPDSENKSKYFQDTFKDIADLAGISVYELDKLFWLGATGNFYLDSGSKSVKGLRLKLISSI